MTDFKPAPAVHGHDFYFAKMLVALELRRTHGIVFAAAFLDQFMPELCRAAAKLASRPRSDGSVELSD